jgi:hypothetical protein
MIRLRIVVQLADELAGTGEYKINSSSFRDVRVPTMGSMV